jgi:hypothetical protein
MEINNEEKIILKPVTDSWLFQGMTKFQKIRFLIKANIEYFFIKMWWKITGKR